MIFPDLVAGDRVFVDSNTLIFYHAPHPVLGAACSQFIRRIENQELIGYSATPVLTEVAHRLMIFEASNLPGWTLVGAKRRQLMRFVTIDACFISHFTHHAE